jgi:hypothetical protein
MFVEAIAQDFGHRSQSETLMAEILPALLMIGSASGQPEGLDASAKRRGTRCLLFWPAP